MLLTITNMRGIDYGKLIQNVFTTAKTGALLALIVLGLVLGRNAHAVAANFAGPWPRQNYEAIVPGLSVATSLGLIVALCVVQTGSLFAADAWNNVTFTAGEIKNPRRNLPLSLALGTGIVIGIYLLVNVAVPRYPAAFGDPARTGGSRRHRHAGRDLPRHKAQR